MSEERSGGALGALSWLALLVTVLAVLGLAAAGPGYQERMWGLGTSFALLRYAGWALAGGFALALLLVLIQLFGGARRHLNVSVLALLVSGGVLYYLMPYVLSVRTIPVLSDMTGIATVPPIHDITTDTEDPPQFDAAVNLRAKDWMTKNPPEYAGPEAAEQQKAFEGYADIKPAYFDAPADVVFDRALKTVKEDFGWLVMSESKEKGVIEAAETSFWFGFTDDVVIRIRTEDGRTRLDMRSKSRIGQSDVGMNAKRIRRFMKAMRGAEQGRAG